MEPQFVFYRKLKKTRETVELYRENEWLGETKILYSILWQASFFFGLSLFCCLLHHPFSLFSLKSFALASCFTTFIHSPLGLVQNSSLIFLSSFTICIIIIHHHLCCCRRRCCCYCYFYYDHYYFVSNLIYWSCRILRAFSLVFLVMRLQGMHYVFYVIMPKPDLFISQVVRPV